MLTMHDLFFSRWIFSGYAFRSYICLSINKYEHLLSQVHGCSLLEITLMYKNGWKTNWRWTIVASLEQTFVLSSNCSSNHQQSYSLGKHGYKHSVLFKGYIHRHRERHECLHWPMDSNWGSCKIFNGICVQQEKVFETILTPEKQKR